MVIINDSLIRIFSITRNYFTGDGAYIDDDGYFWITGRVDDVLNVSGHRIGTAEVEGTIGAAGGVAAAVVDIITSTGEIIYAFLR